MLRKSLLAFVLVITCVSCALAAEYSGGSGSEEDPYIIASVSDMVELQSDSSTSGKYFLLSDDIRMTQNYDWTPGSSFGGHFNGNGKTIYVNMRCEGGVRKTALFGTVSSGASIVSLDVEGSITSYLNAAGIALVLDGGTISDCRFAGDIHVTDYDIAEPDTNVHITKSNLNAGGIVAIMNSGTITGCTFEGSAAVEGGFYPSAGGITAMMFGGSISDCYASPYARITANASELQIIDDNRNDYYYPVAVAGGIAGYVNLTGTSETISECSFNGTVDSDSWHESYSGGIAGYMYGGTLSGNDVLDDSVITGTYTAGGIVGFIRTGGTVEDNHVQAGSTVSAESYSAGGIIGILDLGTITKTVANNESYATITGNASYQGGIIGKITSATGSTAPVIIIGNTYTGADYGIGSDASGHPSNNGTDTNSDPTGPQFYITTSAALSSGKIYDSYSQTFTTSVSSDSAVWLKVDGDFPSGLTLSGNTLSGTPTETGTFEFTLRASLYALYKTAEKTFSLTIDPKLNITTSELESGTKGKSYGPVTLATDAEDGAYVTWLASGLPDGLTLGELTGILSGTPSVSGYYEFTVTAQSGSYTATKELGIIIKPSLQIMTDSTLSSALMNSEYSTTLKTDASDSESVTWSQLSGTLPTGLTLSDAGVISGTPTVSGTYEFVVQASVDGTDYTDSKDFQITVDPVITITTSSTLPSVKAGNSYSQTLSATPSELSFTWEIQSGSLPSGMSLGSSTGIISGTASTAGTYTFTIRASSGSAYSDKIFTLTVTPELSITTEELDDAKMNQAYSFTLATDIEDDDASVMWSISGGSLPDGIYLASYTGVIHGTPTTAGYYTFTVKAFAGGHTAEKTLGLMVKPALSITTSSLPAGIINQVYSQDIETDAEEGNVIVWTLVSGNLPSGISFDTSTGSLYGTPTKTGTYTFTIGASTGSYKAENKKFTLKILPSMTITTSSPLTNAKVSHSYTATISAASIADEAYTWLLSGGELPDGLALNESTASSVTITGTPTTAGTYTFTLTVTAAGLTAGKTFTLTVDSLLSITTDSPLPNAVMNQSYSCALESDNETGNFVTWSISGGSMPAGLVIGSYTGVISGIPTTSGYYTFTVKASTGSLETEKEFGITVAPSLTITTSSDLAPGIINMQYSQTLLTDAPEGNVVTWSVKNGKLPDGLNLDSSSGTISGVPSREGTYTFTVLADTSTLAVSKDFNLTIRPALYIATDSRLPAVKVLHDYSVTLQASSISGAVFTWSLTEGDLPDGLTLNESAGNITGTPASGTEGEYAFTVQVSAAGMTASKTFTLEVRPSLYITTSSPLPTVKVGSQYEVLLSTDIDSDMLITWSVISGDLPNGLTLRPNTGVISGVPDTEGTYVFVIHAEAGLLSTSKTFILTVKPALSITTPSELPDARPSESYSQTLETDAESIDVVAWQFISGDLPEGFTFRNETGTVSGMSTREGIYEFTIRAEVQTKARRLSAQKTFVLAVRPEMLIENPDTYTIDAGSYVDLTLEAMIIGTSEADSLEAVRWSFAGGEVPEGLSVNEEGTITGTPSKAGTFTFTLQAMQGYALGRKNVTFNVNLVISSGAYLPNATRGISYSELLLLKGASSAEWSITSGNLPSGLTIGTTSGLISGTPTTEGTYNFTVQASADKGLTTSKLMRIIVDTASTLPITTSSLPSGRAGESYYAVLYSTVSNVRWEITDGFLPNGLTLNQSNGLIEGTPLESGTFRFTVRASYGSREGTRQLTITIVPAEESHDEHASVSSSGGGGCNTGLNFMMLLVSLGFIRRRRI